MENQTMTIGKKWGLILGGVLAAFDIVFYSVDISLFVSTGSIILMAVVIVIGFMTAKDYKTINEGFGSFSDILKTLLISFIIAVGISLIVKYILFSLIDPEASHQISQLSADKSQQLAEKFGIEYPEEQYDKVVDSNLYSPLSSFINFISITFGNIIFGLIIAAITKNEKPEFE